MEAESDIAKWYRGKAILITGATGFMGKVLVEKLLRSCPDVGPIYILVREKKKTLPRDRVDEMMASSIFDKVRAMKMYQEDLLFPIPGDMRLPGLGISAENRHLLQKTVSVVFHLAATVRFNEPLRIAVAINLEAAKTLMEFCLGMTNLSAIVHVSTAYTNCTRPMIEERVYPPPADPDKIMHCVAGMDDDLLEFIVPRLIGNHPNTYTFTKALAEHVIAGYSTKLPVVVVRPSIVSASWKEPFPGWVFGVNGSTGIVAGSGKGLLKNLYGNSQMVMDMIPVDVCINLFIAAAWEIGSRERTKLVPNVRVYNCVSEPFKSLLWSEFALAIDNCSRRYPMSDILTTPRLTMTNSKVKESLSNLLELTLPAILADIFIRLLGGRPRFQSNLYKWKKLTTVVEFFTYHEFKFNADNVEELKCRLNPADRVIFDFDITKINWKKYFTEYFLGVRRYVANEKDDTIPAARQRVTRLALIIKAVQIGILAVVTITFFQIYRLSGF